MTDPLDQYKSASTCPNCHAITRFGISKCPECGTFHSTAHLTDRVPTAEDLRPHEERIVEPEMYSLNPNSNIDKDGEFEEVEDVTTEWEGGSTDFSFIDEEEVLPQSESDSPNEEIIIDD